MKLILSAVLAATIAISSLTLDAEFADAQAVAPITTPGRVILNNCPNGVRERPEIRTLSTQQRDAFINAILKLQSGNAPTRYDEYSNLHNSATKYAHGTCMFLPWHRRYLMEFELDLQAIDPSIMLPYWDWSLDSQAPETSIVFTKDYFGGNSGKSNCVEDGPFANWKPYYPQPACFSRGFDDGDTISAFYSTEAIQKIITGSGNFPAFTSSLEGSPHGNVHNGIGGITSTMYSPADPIFFLHHGMVDRTWWQWQNARPNNFNDFSGRTSTGALGTGSTKIWPWYDHTVQDMFNTTALCYTYGDVSANQVDTVDTTQSSNPAGGNQTAAGGSQTAAGGNQTAAGGNSQLVRRGDYNATPLPPAPSHSSHPCGCQHANNTALLQPTTNAPITPTSDNRDSLTKLRLPKAIPADWLRMNNLAVDAIRAQEADFKNNLYNPLNSIQGYVSTCALVNRGDMLSKLVAAGKTVFTAGFGSNRIPVTINSTDTGNIDSIVSDIRGKVANYISAGSNLASNLASNLTDLIKPANILAEVSKIIGTPSQAGIPPTSAANFELVSGRDFSNGWTPIAQALANIQVEPPAVAPAPVTPTDQTAAVDDDEDDCEEDDEEEMPPAGNSSY